MQRRHPGHCFPRPAEERGCPAADRPRHRTRRASLGPRTHRGRNAGQKRGLFRYQRTGRTRKETGVHRLQQKSGPGNHGARRGRNRHPRHTPRLSLHGRTRPARAFHGRAQTPHPVRRTAQFSTDEPGLGHYGQKHRPPLLPKDSVEFYRPETADWMSYGWIGGLINTYPMLALGDDEHLRRVARTFDFALPRAKGKSGYYHDILQPDGTVLNRDAAAVVPGVAVTRRNGDVLYWMVKQFNLLESMGHKDFIRPEWEKNVRSLADAFVNTWKNEGTWGNYLHVESGKVAVYNTTGGAMAIGGLALASVYFNCPEYLEIARQAASALYRQFAIVGFTSGGCGDILQNSDSETAVALATSLFTLYETTGETEYLQQARDAAHLCATWTVSFDYRLPEDTPLAQLGANLTGAVWASTQNKHGAPGFCTQSGDVLFKLYRTTGDTLYAELLRDIIHAHAEGIQPNGKITERLTYCDSDRRGSRADGWETGWNETNGALMALEIPGIYVRTDLDKLYVFDHVKAEIIKSDKRKTILRITNPTEFDAQVTLFAEGAEESALPLGDNAFLNWQDKVKVKAGQTVTYTIKKK